MDETAMNGHDPYAGLYGSPDESNPSVPAPRLRLRLRKPDPPNRHPHHAPPKAEHASLEEWLKQDDPLDGEEALRITKDKVEEEAERRLQIVEAAEHGVLSQARCSVYAPEAAPEPPPQYGHWDHVVAHALHFNKLLKEEKAYHRRTAKILAREAYDFWKNKFKRKSQDEIEQEETERQVTRYKQLVKDVKDAWGLVKVEIDKERVAKWEEEQLQLGHKAMDDMFNQAQEILGGRNVGDGASSLVSEDRDFDDDDDEDIESGASNTSEQQHDDDVMSSSSDSEEENEQDDDANLTAEQLREKYGQLPDLPESSSEIEADSDDEDDAKDSDKGTPTPTPDPEIEPEDGSELPENAFLHTNGFHAHDEEEDKKKPDYIDPATVELDQVDEALLDSDDENKGSESGSLVKQRGLRD
jgi:helicase SWR1